MAAKLVADINFSLTAQPKQNNIILEMQHAIAEDKLTLSVKESLMSTCKNPMISPSDQAQDYGKVNQN